MIFVFACDVKVFAIANVFLSFFFPYDFFGRTGKSLLRVFHELLLQMGLTSTGTYFVDTLAKSNVFLLSFRVWEHDMSCALQINSNSWCKWASGQGVNLPWWASTSKVHWSYMTHWSRGLGKWLDKLKASHFYYHSAHGYQT